MIEIDLTTRLKTLCPHVYAMEAPEDFDLPCVVYSAINIVPVVDFSSVIGSSLITYQIDCYDADYISAKTLARDVRTSIASWASVSPVIQNGRDTIDKTTASPLYCSMIEAHLFDHGN